MNNKTSIETVFRNHFGEVTRDDACKNDKFKEHSPYEIMNILLSTVGETIGQYNDIDIESLDLGKFCDTVKTTFYQHFGLRWCLWQLVIPAWAAFYVKRLDVVLSMQPITA